jgi:hypothetical protein
MKIIDVSGFGHSGKTAVTDLFREVEGVNVHHPSFEFNLLRLPDGLIDLKRNVIDFWSPIKSDFALKRFSKLCNRLNGNYSDQLNADFLQLSNEFVNSLILDTLNVEWYDDLYSLKKSTIKDLLRVFLKSSGLLRQIRSVKKKLFQQEKSKKELVYIVNQEKIIEKINKYLESILLSNTKFCGTVVTNNAFEPFDPYQNMSFFNDPYCIIVNRDFLLKYNDLEQTPLEIIESVDMMRILENGMKVKMVFTENESYAVDTKTDLDNVIEKMKSDKLINIYSQ